MIQLSAKHQKFVSEYIKHLNAAQAYLAVYKCAPSTARTAASKLLQRDDVKQALAELMSISTKDTLIHRLNLLVELDILNYLTEGDQPQIDLNKLRDAGLGWIVAQIRPSGEVVLISKDKILEMLAKAYSLYTDNGITVNIEEKLSIQDKLNNKLDELQSVIDGN